MRIAIVGSGVSGLVAAHELHQDHEIVVFEANDYIGGHTHTVTVDDPRGPLGVDTGFIVFNDRNYPLFSQLLSDLGVDAHDSDMSFAVNCERTGLEYRASSLDTLFAQRRNLLRPSFYGMIRDIFRFFREAPALLDEPDDSTTLGEYLERNGYSELFVEKHILPMCAALWSASKDSLRRFPARYFVRFLANHGMMARHGRPQWRVVTGGSDQYVQALTQPFRKQVRLRTPVRSIRRHVDRVDVLTDDVGSESFDRVILAVHSDQALHLLDNPSAEEQAVLSSIPYQRNEVVLHTDPTIMPARRKVWAAWNHHVLRDSREEVAVTYWMNKLQSLQTDRDYFVTLNAADKIRAENVLASFTYHHPVFTPEGVAQQHRQPTLGVGNRTHYCGAYWGFGFHEDGVRSAQRAVASLRNLATSERVSYEVVSVGQESIR